MDSGEDTSDYAGQDNGTLRVTIREEASRLGVTEAAIRKRTQRGSVNKEMGEDARVYVYPDVYEDMSQPESQVNHEPLVEGPRPVPEAGVEPEEPRGGALSADRGGAHHGQRQPHGPAGRTGSTGRRDSVLPYARGCLGRAFPERGRGRGGSPPADREPQKASKSVKALWYRRLFGG